MPSPLKFFKTDPNGQGRGRGVYYHRGKGVYSKYSIERDAKIKAKGFKKNKVGAPKNSRLLHTSDGVLKR